MATVRYRVFRNDGPGNRPEQLREFLQACIAAFYRTYRRLPAGVVVHPSAVVRAQAVLQDLELRLPVRGTGGCLVNEVWLAMEEK